MALIPTGNACNLCDRVCTADSGDMEMEETDFTWEKQYNLDYTPLNGIQLRKLTAILGTGTRQCSSGANHYERDKML